MTPLQERFKEAIEKQDLTITHELDGIHITKLSPVEIHAAAIDCEKIAEEFAEEFAVWFWLTEPKWKRDKLTTKQILQQFKEGRK